MLEKLATLDRRWLFLVMAIAIIVPLLVPVSLPFEASPPVRATYDAVEALRPGQTVLLSIDYDPAARPEVEPWARAVLRHLLRRRVKIVMMTLWDKAPPIVRSLINEIVLGEYNQRRGYFAPDQPGGRLAQDYAPYRYGEDYVFLGYKDGKEIVIAGMGQNLRQMFPVAEAEREGGDKIPVARIPVLSGISSLRDFALILEASAGFPGAKEYVQQVVTRYRLRFAAATTAVSVTDLSPYYPEQMLGLIGGMRGSAEYEQLVEAPGLGTSGLNVLTFGQIFVILAIVLGNVIFFLQRRLRPRSSPGAGGGVG
ncbi:MAG: hypothetical protein IT379_33940 [Deltaproteobacteria bacterium]|nr:hypothetical protein [Deltaproteobacteria bacterium]